MRIWCLELFVSRSNKSTRARDVRLDRRVAQQQQQRNSTVVSNEGEIVEIGGSVSIRAISLVCTRSLRRRVHCVSQFVVVYSLLIHPRHRARLVSRGLANNNAA